MMQMLSFHALAALRGDGLRPELLALLESQVHLQPGLCASIEPEVIVQDCPQPQPAPVADYSSNGCLPSTSTT